MNTRTSRNISFGLLAAVAAILAGMTAGIRFGWPDTVYTSWPMTVLWGCTAVAATILIIRTRLYRRPVTAAIHLGLLMILAGACVTHFYGVDGSMHLRVGDPPSLTVSLSDGAEAELPTGVTLDGLEIATYPGTDTPRDYICKLSSRDDTIGVSMNRPAALCGYTFTINSHDSDSMGATFMVSRDPAGTGITYAGYLILALSLAGYFLVKDTSWRQSLRKLSLVLCVLAVTPASADVSEAFATGFGRIPVCYNGRICPVSTLAADFTRTITGGSASYRGNSAERVLAGFLFDFGEWKRRPVIRIKDKELRRMLQIDGEYASYEQFYRGVSSGTPDPDDPGDRTRFAQDLDRFEAVNMLVCGESLKIFPVRNDDGSIRWYSPTDRLPAGLDNDRWIFIRKYLGMLNEQVQRRDPAQQRHLLSAIKKYQSQVVGEEMPGENMFRAERIYNCLSSQRWMPASVVMAGMLLFILMLIKEKTGRIFRTAGVACALAIALLLSVLIALRWIIGGHVPVSNGYETMMFLAWILAVISVACFRIAPVLPLGIVASGLAWSVARIGGSGASVTGLSPVLSSPLLSLHVALVMLSYALFLLMALTGVAGLVKTGSRRQLSALVNVMLYPATALLALGIFTGAVWADMSWGRYWGWDPKEVWALITLLVYSFPLHSRIMPFFRRPRALLLFSVFAFISVLITYFGVNFLLGGLHSYA